jgi:hypothetical protein
VKSNAVRIYVEAVDVDSASSLLKKPSDLNAARLELEDPSASSRG